MKTQKNDLLGYGLKIYQNSDYFKFSIDSVLLAEFVNLKLSDKLVLDMCTGNAPILLILAQKNPNIEYYGIELQKEVYDLAQKSILENNFKINLINDNIKNMDLYFKENYFDIITCNPPYFKTNELTKINDNKIKAIARHELFINLEEIIESAYKYLKNNGYFYLVHRPDRFMEIIECLKKYNFSIKTLRFAYKNKGKNCCCILFECVKNGSTETLIEKPIFIDDLERR